MDNQKRLSIFVDCHVIDGTFQGTTTYLIGLYREAINNKAFNFYFAADDLQHAKHAFGHADNIYYLKYPAGNKFLRLLFTIPFYIKKYNIDFAHFQYIVPPIKFCKYINTIHDVLFFDHPQYFPYSYRLRNQLLFKWSAKHSDIVATVSQYSAQKLKEHFNIDTIVTPNAVDSHYFEEYDKNDAVAQINKKYGFDAYWLYVSRWEPRKNHHAVLKVFVENGHYKKFHLVFAGYRDIENPEFTILYNSLTDEVKSKVVILGSIPFPDLVLLVRAASLAVYPSLAEGFGIPPLESAAAGIPTICSNATAMKDFTFFGQALFNPQSDIAMQAAIVATLQQYDAGSVKAAIAAKYNWALSARTLLEALEE